MPEYQTTKIQTTQKSERKGIRISDKFWYSVFRHSLYATLSVQNPDGRNCDFLTIRLVKMSKNRTGMMRPKPDLVRISDTVFY